MYWESRFPRILTTEDIIEATQSNRTRLLGVADISADPNACTFPLWLLTLLRKSRAFVCVRV